MIPDCVDRNYITVNILDCQFSSLDHDSRLTIHISRLSTYDSRLTILGRLPIDDPSLPSRPRRSARKITHSFESTRTLPLPTRFSFEEDHTWLWIRQNSSFPDPIQRRRSHTAVNPSELFFGISTQFSPSWKILPDLFRLTDQIPIFKRSH